MEIALFTPSTANTPLQSLQRMARRRLDRWQLARMGRHTARVVAMATPLKQQSLVPATVETTVSPQVAMVNDAHHTHVPAQITTDRSGRVVISGSMADVCAELARLVELEARAGTQTAH